MRPKKKDSSIYKVFTNGSGIDRKIGASAILFEHGIELGALQLYLGKVESHTVFKGNRIGSILTR